MHDGVTIVRERQLVIRREMDRRGISLKAVSLDSGVPYDTVKSYFPGERDREPATIPASVLFLLCSRNALSLDLLSLLLPDGFQIIRAPEDLDHAALGKWAADYLAAKNAAHHPDSECAEAIGPGERARLDGKVAHLPRVRAA